jgi:hypothetical protein
MSGKSTFKVTVDGESISIPLSRARVLCPAEVAAMESAGKRVSEAAERGDSRAMALASEELQQRMEALLHALAEKARQNRKGTPQEASAG